MHPPPTGTPEAEMPGQAAASPGADESMEHGSMTASTSPLGLGMSRIGSDLRWLTTIGPVQVGLGLVGSVYVLDGGLRGFYGGQQFPVAGMVFLRLWPVDMHHSMAGMSHTGMEHGH